MVPWLAEVEHFHQKPLKTFLDIFHLLEGAPPQALQCFTELNQLHRLADRVAVQTLFSSSIITNMLVAVAEAAFSQKVDVAGPNLKYGELVEELISAHVSCLTSLQNNVEAEAWDGIQHYLFNLTGQ